ncbi:MAG: glycosyltransferase family 2 protein [Clostridia bacterium]|nr:glycosyltransferase family 2 protein [Clostridia bacterium]
MTRPLITIVIPAYNCEKYIPKCLESLINQSYDNFEIVIVNDGSRDNTARIIDEYAQKYDFIKAYHKENGGVTSARLKGVELAKGDYIGFIDSDDEIEPDMYELLMSNALKYQADISHCGYQMVFPSRIDLYHGTGELLVEDNKQGIISLLSGEKVEPGLCNKLFKKELFYDLLKLDLMDRSIKNNEDLLMNFYLFKNSQKSVFEDVCKYKYILNAQSATGKSLNVNQLLDPVKVKKILLQETKGEDDCQSILTSHIVSHLVSLATMSTKENPQLIKPIRKDARKELRAMLPSVLKTQDNSVKLKALWGAYLPTSYRWVHNIYLKITGLDKIYEIS